MEVIHVGVDDIGFPVKNEELAVVAEQEVDSPCHDPIKPFAGGRPVNGQFATRADEGFSQIIGGETIAETIGESQFVEAVLRRNGCQREINCRKRVEENAACHVKEGILHLPSVIFRFIACEIEFQMILSGRQK